MSHSGFEMWRVIVENRNFSYPRVLGALSVGVIRLEFNQYRRHQRTTESLDFHAVLTA